MWKEAPNGLNPIGQFLPKVLDHAGVTPKNFAVAALVERALTEISASARIVGFKNNKIFVEVESSVELQELTLKRGEIFKKLRDAFPVDSLASAIEIKFFLKGMARPGAQERIAWQKRRISGLANKSIRENRKG